MEPFWFGVPILNLVGLNGRRQLISGDPSNSASLNFGNLNHLPVVILQVAAKKIRTYPITDNLLKDYARAALLNAADLLLEGNLLLANNRVPRAYFLAVAAIEETGKASLAFNGIGRRFSDPAVCTKLRLSFESHQQKIFFAFIPWLMNDPNADLLKTQLNWASHLRHGREPSMYTDISADGSEVKEPSKLVRYAAALDCLRLAKDCLQHATDQFQKSKPIIKTAVDDAFFAMKQAHVTQVFSNSKFWEHHTKRRETGINDFSQDVLDFHRGQVK